MESTDERNIHSQKDLHNIYPEICKVKGNTQIQLMRLIPHKVVTKSHVEFATFFLVN